MESSPSQGQGALVVQPNRSQSPVAIREHLASASEAMQDKVQNVARRMQDIRPNHLFEYGVLAGKASMILVLLLFAIINSDTSFVCYNPKFFISECIIVGGCTAIPTIVLAYNRKTPVKDTSNAFMIAFLVFFIL